MLSAVRVSDSAGKMGRGTIFIGAGRLASFLLVYWLQG